MRTLHLYSEGNAVTRFEKTKRVAEYSPSWKYLNICIESGRNCGICSKCIRTLLAIDALGKLEKYSEVFDIESYRKNRNGILWGLLKNVIRRDIFALEVLPYFKKELIFRLFCVIIGVGLTVLAILFFMWR